MARLPPGQPREGVMLQTTPAKARSSWRAKRSLHDIVFDEEDLFREVKDWAFLLADRLWQKTPIDGGQEQEALGRVAGQLLGAGNKLDALFDELFELGRDGGGKT